MSLHELQELKKLEKSVCRDSLQKQKLKNVILKDSKYILNKKNPE